MPSFGKLTYDCLIAVVILAGVPLGDQRPQQIAKEGSNQVFYSFPANSVQCRAGDYIISKSVGKGWKVYSVEELFFTSRLSTMNSSGGLTVVEQMVIADSATPPKWHQIQLLVNEFKKEFATREDAIKAVESDTLGDFIRGLCRGVEEFPKESCEVFRKR